MIYHILFYKQIFMYVVGKYSAILLLGKTHRNKKMDKTKEGTAQNTRRTVVNKRNMNGS